VNIRFRPYKNSGGFAVSFFRAYSKGSPAVIIKGVHRRSHGDKEGSEDRIPVFSRQVQGSPSPAVPVADAGFSHEKTSGFFRISLFKESPDIILGFSFGPGFGFFRNGFASGKKKRKNENTRKKGCKKSSGFHIIIIDRKKAHIEKNRRQSSSCQAGLFFADNINIMDYELLTSEKQRIIMDLAEKAIFLRPALASFSVKSLDEKIEDFARSIAESIED
jgi:hypothetical protein